MSSQLYIFGRWATIAPCIYNTHETLSIEAPPAKRQCRAGPKAGARRGFPPNSLPTPNENDILSQKAEQTIQFCWPDNSWNINARLVTYAPLSEGHVWRGGRVWGMYPDRSKVGKASLARSLPSR
jgi:hypothetical protein